MKNSRTAVGYVVNPPPQLRGDGMGWKELMDVIRGKEEGKDNDWITLLTVCVLVCLCVCVRVSTFCLKRQYIFLNTAGDVPAREITMI